MDTNTPSTHAWARATTAGAACDNASTSGAMTSIAVAAPIHASPSPMKASGRRPCAASQLPARGPGTLRAGEDSDPTPVGLLVAIMVESPRPGFAEQMTGLAIGDGAQPLAGGQ